MLAVEVVDEDAVPQLSIMPTQYVPQQLPVEVQQTPPQHCCVEVHGYSSASVQHCVVALTQEPAHVN